MPVTEFQLTILKLLFKNRSNESYLAGGSALHFKPNSLRFSNDINYFHSSVESVERAFEADKFLLEKAGYSVSVVKKHETFIRAFVTKGSEGTKIEWALDSIWRFMPLSLDPDCGSMLHPIDLALNKVLALIGRNETRDYLDVVWAHKNLLPLGALCWAAVSKDPGFSPDSILELLRRRGVIRREDLDALVLSEPIDLKLLKLEWLSALDEAEEFISRPFDATECLFFDTNLGQFVAPSYPVPPHIIPHFGSKGGVAPRFS